MSLKHHALLPQKEPNQATEAHSVGLSRSLSRRTFLKYALVGAMAAGAIPALSHFSSALAAEPEGNSILILYFSHSGNTRKVAEQIHTRMGGDLIELNTVSPYPRDYDAVVEQAKQEQRDNARPQISTEIPNLAAYDTVFIGFPNWWGTMPMLFFTLLETYDLGGKTIVPFCTHGGSRLGRAEDDLKRLCPRANILKGFEVSGSRASDAQGAVDAWLRKAGLLAEALL